VKVLVFGCGPAGLIAAHAARTEFDCEVRILSVKRPSELYGCQYLHDEIVGIPTKHEMVRYSLNGTAEEYRRKVYGAHVPPLPVSPQLFEGDAPAWDIRDTYRQLFDVFEDYIIDVRMNNEGVISALSDYMPDFAISSIPANVLCMSPTIHAFTSTPVWAVGDGPDRDVPVNVAPQHVLCDGTEFTGWYRAANVFGHRTVEWPGYLRKVPLRGVVKVNKPLATDCNCLQSVLRVGRMGRWAKGVLAHQSYAATCRFISTGESV
jgi:hypothetical protein